MPEMNPNIYVDTRAVTVNVPQSAAPDVIVQVPQQLVPDITVHVPETNVTVEMPKLKRKKLIRDGKVTAEVVEEYE